MTPSLEVIVAGISLAVQLIVAAYVYGKFTQKIEENSERTIEHAKALEIHRGRLDGHDVQLGEMKAWRDGYNAASSQKVNL